MTDLTMKMVIHEGKYALLIPNASFSPFLKILALMNDFMIVPVDADNTLVIFPLHHVDYDSNSEGED